ncbi:MAG TPA: PfkB family carbohydrate kinase, partial [Tepidisphaeraceae bacterium]|nr:PfkB family carbohydrate kinase [Tepidisphaeraceae bacterium]
QCLTIIDRSTGAATELIEESSALADEDYEALQVRLEDVLDDARMLVLSGSLPPNGPADLYAKLVSLARAKGVRTIVDARDEPLRLAADAGADVCKVNVSELLSTIASTDDSPDGIVHAIESLRQERDGWVIVTHGAQPTLVGGRDGLYRLDAPPGRRACGGIGVRIGGRDVPARRRPTRLSLRQRQRDNPARGIHRSSHRRTTPATGELGKTSVRLPTANCQVPIGQRSPSNVRRSFGIRQLAIGNRQSNMARHF